MEPGPQFHQYKRTTYRIEPDDRWRRSVNAYNDRTGQQVGRLGWWGDNPEQPDPHSIANVDVLKSHRGRGIADAMLHYAKGLEPELHHSRILTDDGKAWAAKHPI